MTMTKDDFIAEVFEIAFGNNAINRNFTFDEVIEELKNMDIEGNMAHPPYYCDGGCGKIVGDGYDDECKRICSLCEVKGEEEEERDEEDSVYNYHICRICLKNHDETEVDCKYCKGKMCVILSQDTTQKRAIQQTLEMYYSKLFK